MEYSIEWLFNQIEGESDFQRDVVSNRLEIKISVSDFLEIKRIAKEMHKQEIIDAWNSAGGGDAYHSGKQYYQETFGSKGSDDTSMERKLLKSGFVDVVPKQNDVREVVVDDVEKLAEAEYPIYDGDLLGIANNQKHSRIDFIKGYNKAKETLYTEEQVREVMDFARGHHKMTDTQFIQSLKQPKKD